REDAVRERVLAGEAHVAVHGVAREAEHARVRARERRRVVARVAHLRRARAREREREEAEDDGALPEERAELDLVLAAVRVRDGEREVGDEGALLEHVNSETYSHDDLWGGTG